MEVHSSSDNKLVNIHQEGQNIRESEYLKHSYNPQENNHENYNHEYQPYQLYNKDDKKEDQVCCLFECLNCIIASLNLSIKKHL